MAKTKTSKKYEDKITKKVMAIIFVFFICNITDWFVIFGARYFEIIGTTLAVSLFDLSAVVNGSVNVVIYGFFDKKFRRIFKKRICPCIKPEPSRLNSRNSIQLSGKVLRELTEKVTKSSSTSI